MALIVGDRRIPLLPFLLRFIDECNSIPRGIHSANGAIRATLCQARFAYVKVHTQWLMNGLDIGLVGGFVGLLMGATASLQGLSPRIGGKPHEATKTPRSLFDGKVSESFPSDSWFAGQSDENSR